MCVTFSVFSRKIPKVEGIVFHGYSVRNMEWSTSMPSEVWYVPRDISGPFQKPEDYDLKKWDISKYSFFAINRNKNDDVFTEGMNEEGLSVSLLMFSDEGSWAKAWPEWLNEDGLSAQEKAKLKSECLEISNLVEYLLGRYESISQIITHIRNDTFPHVVIKQETLQNIHPAFKGGDRLNGSRRFLPVHACVYDKAGNVAILEWRFGVMQVYCGEYTSHKKNKSRRGHIIGQACNVLANNPGYDWHLEYLRWNTWLKLTDDKYPKQVTLANGYKVKSGADYMGLAGLSADLSSPTRFLRAVVLSALTERNFHKDKHFKSHEARISHLFSLAGILAEPKSYRHDYYIQNGEKRTQSRGNVLDGCTVWTIVHDHCGSSADKDELSPEQRAIYIQSYDRKTILRFGFGDYSNLTQVTAICEIDNEELCPYWKNVTPDVADIIP